MRPECFASGSKSKGNRNEQMWGAGMEKWEGRRFGAWVCMACVFGGGGRAEESEDRGPHGASRNRKIKRAWLIGMG